MHDLNEVTYIGDGPPDGQGYLQNVCPGLQSQPRKQRKYRIRYCTQQDTKSDQENNYKIPLQKNILPPSGNTCHQNE